MSGPTSGMVAKQSDRRWALILSYVCLGLFGVFFLAPPYYMLVTSLKTNAEITSLSGIPWIIEQGVTLAHYTNLFFNTFFPLYFLNTTIVTLLRKCSG